jgi:hypothetical protein
MANLPAWEAVWQGNGEAQAQIVADGLGVRGIRARIQGARPIDGLPHAFQVNTWAVVVPTQQAAEARDVLLDRGEAAGIVAAADGSAAEKRATLRFVLLLAASVVAFALLMALRQSL